MVKNVFRILPVVALTVVLTAAMTMPDKAGAAVSAKKPKATNVQYFKEDGKKTGIKTFTIDTYTYYNMSKNKDLNPSQQSTMKLDDAALLRIAKKQIFPKWGLIAEEVFRDQANQLVTIEGKGMMSSRDSSKKTDFDRHFSTGKVSNGYTDKWAVKDLAEYLSKETSLQNGDTCWDETRVTGITKIGSLNDARTLMGQELRNCSDDNDVSKDEFLGNNHQKNEDTRRLPDLEDDKTGDGFANVVTCVNRAGASGDKEDLEEKGEDIQTDNGQECEGKCHIQDRRRGQEIQKSADAEQEERQDQGQEEGKEGHLQDQSHSHSSRNERIQGRIQNSDCEDQSQLRCPAK